MITAARRRTVKPKRFTMDDARAFFATQPTDVRRALNGIGVTFPEAEAVRARAYLAGFFAPEGQATRTWADAMVREMTALLAAKAAARTPADMTADDELAELAAHLADDDYPAASRPAPRVYHVDPADVDPAELAELRIA